MEHLSTRPSWVPWWSCVLEDFDLGRHRGGPTWRRWEMWSGGEVSDSNSAAVEVSFPLILVRRSHTRVSSSFSYLFVKLKAKFTGWHARYARWWRRKPWLHDQIKIRVVRTALDPLNTTLWTYFFGGYLLFIVSVSARCAPWDMMVGSPCHPPSADPFRCPLPATNPPWRPLRRRAPWGAAPSCQPTHRPGSRPVVWAACMARNDLRDWEMSTNRMQKISKTQRLPLT